MNLSWDTGRSDQTNNRTFEWISVLVLNDGGKTATYWTPNSDESELE